MENEQPDSKPSGMDQIMNSDSTNKTEGGAQVFYLLLKLSIISRSQKHRRLFKID